MIFIALEFMENVIGINTGPPTRCTGAFDKTSPPAILLSHLQFVDNWK